MSASSRALTHTPHLRYLLCHFFSFSFPSSYTLTFFPPASLSFSHSVSRWYAMLSCSICTLNFLLPMQSACHSWDACLSFSLFLPISLDLWLPLRQADCLFLFLSLCMFLAVSPCLHLPPTLHLSVSALHHFSINVLMCLHISNGFFFFNSLSFYFLLRAAIVFQVHNGLLINCSCLQVCTAS